MAFAYFSTAQLVPFIIGGVCLICSIGLFLGSHRKLSLIFLFSGAISLGFFISNLDPFLNLWDEQFHALVARNMVETPLMPRLYPVPILEYTHTDWTQNYIWLHKQPLFLWQIALSIKLFGASELAVRLPGILMFALAALFVYRIGKIAYSDRVGFFGAVFFISVNYLLELLTGKHSTDHNDVAFLFYVTASFWAWFEYQAKKSVYWIVLIGIFSGCAILVKWLVGLLIYAVWFLTIGANNRKDFFRIKNYYPMLIAFGVTMLITLPWQLFILNAYPVEATYEFKLNSTHFFHAVEGHGGDFWYHFRVLKKIYGSGDLIPFLLLAGLIIFLIGTRHRKYRIAIGAAVVIVYGFFSIAATKMDSFCIIVLPFVMLGMAAFVDKIFLWIAGKNRFHWLNNLFQFIIIGGLSYSFINLSKVAGYHVDKGNAVNELRSQNLKLMQFIDQLPREVKEQPYVVFIPNHRLKSSVPVMFYTHVIAYDFIPTQEQLEKVWKQSYAVAIEDNGNLPDYIREDARILKL